MRIARTGSRADLWVLAATAAVAGALALPHRDLVSPIPELEIPVFAGATYVRGDRDCPASRLAVRLDPDGMWLGVPATYVRIDKIGGRYDWASFAAELPGLARASRHDGVELAASDGVRYGELREAMAYIASLERSPMYVLGPESLSLQFPETP